MQQCHALDEVYRAALEQSILPERYLRNRASVSMAEQLQLARSDVAVVGAGGLGGQALLCLARLGVGRLRVVDPEVFEASNLNRQALCTTASLGRPKTEVARETLTGINPGVRIESCQDRLSPENAASMLQGADVVVDGLDSIQDRFTLEAAARELSIPMVHAAIDGFVVQVMTIFPGDPGLELIYGQERTTRVSPLGNPVFAPHLAATLQAAEVLKVLLNRGRPARNGLISADLESGDFSHFSFGGSHEDM
jgi:molybdopterin/thiamine biosynthesis adenylyltransferase